MKPKPAIAFLSLLICAGTYAQHPFRVMFYNVENLFDVEDEPGKQDDEFTPGGFRHWNNHRYYRKLNNLAKVITSLGEWETPALIGMCEVENEKTVDDLTLHTPLKKMSYRYVMTDSDDARGIDVALLYQRDRFKYLAHNCLPVVLPGAPQRKTRDILHVTGEVATGDTLDVFVCHFPSRRGGEQESAPKRRHAATVVRAEVERLTSVRLRANIVIMGDFNDEPSSGSLSEGLEAILPEAGTKNDRTKLYNLFLPVEKASRRGSFKFRGEWNLLDQVIVSGDLLNPLHPFRALPETATVFQADFLLTRDASHGGKRPRKTFHGYRYEGGYSDHLPVFVDFLTLHRLR
ncbi:MAG: endonuclease [Dysgonamonadaceae bacterium]|jgi:predicted extracellular nuclease|nr:endonuclease [Dysgonamonadaceae bacterium]